MEWLSIATADLTKKIASNSFSGSNICNYDEGSPLYTFKCGTRLPKCLYGVASFYRNKNCTTGEDQCDNGSFFASVPYLYKWIVKTISSNY